MKIALFGSNSLQFSKVYTPAVLSELSKYGILSERISKKNINKQKDFLQDCEIAFATWGMPRLSKEEIKEYLPSLKVLFYSAGTVQYFARPFLESGVRIFSAFAANAVPVAEYTASQIMLASKGFFQASKSYRIAPLYSLVHANSSPGNFHTKVGIIGLGAIGTRVAEKLRDSDIELYAFDPFVSKEKAAELDVKLCTLEEIFSDCDVITNHLANKKELKNFFRFRHFNSMKKHSVFINTGRGAQVSELSLSLSLLLHPSHTFVGDVIKAEYFPYLSPLFWCRNAILTPHIAGSTGNEPQRMAYLMIEELKSFLEGKEASYEIKLSDLEKMA